MKKLLPHFIISFLIFSTAFNINAQIIIDSTDFPQAGNIFSLRSITISPTYNANLTNTGANKVWNYGNLADEIGNYTNKEYIQVTQTPFAYQFFFNNPILGAYRANHAIEAPPLPIPPQANVSISDIYNYFKLTDDTYEMVGFGANINNVPTSNRYIPKDVMYRFPLTFGNKDTSDAAFNVNVPGLGYYGQKINRINEVDGFGQLILPSGIYDVVRVKTSLITIDSIYYADFNFGINLPPQRTFEYKWFAKGEGIPLLTITTRIGGPGGGGGNQAVVSGIEYKDGTVSAPFDITNNNNVEIFPNPSKANNFVNISFSNNFEFKNVLIETIDITGKIIKTENIGNNQKNIQINTNGLSSGIYYLNMIFDNNKRAVKKLIIQ
jgi:hypothetical protein